MDPTLLAAFDAAAAQLKADSDALIPAQQSVVQAQAGLQSAQTALDSAKGGVTALTQTLQTDFSAFIKAGVALGLSPT